MPLVFWGLSLPTAEAGGIPAPDPILVMGKFKRKFGKTKDDEQPFVVDVCEKLKVGAYVMAPESDGSTKRRKIIKVGDSYLVDKQWVARGYLHDGFNTATMLKDKHWTPKQIALLGEPDQLRTNPVVRSGAPVQLWADETIARVQRTKAFKDMIRTHDQVLAAKIRASKAVATKTAKTIALLGRLSVKVRRLENAALLKLAIEHFNERAEYREDFRGDVQYATESSDKKFLERIQVNFARHQLSNYDRNHEELDSHVGHAKARDLMAERVFTEIAKTYPHLEDETKRQLARRADERQMVYMG